MEVERAQGYETMHKPLIRCESSDEEEHLATFTPVRVNRRVSFSPSTHRLPLKT